MIACPNKREELLVVNGNTVQLYNTITKMVGPPVLVGEAWMVCMIEDKSTQGSALCPVLHDHSVSFFSRSQGIYPIHPFMSISISISIFMSVSMLDITT